MSPLFKEPFEKPRKPTSDTSCGAGRKLVKGFTRKDGRKVASFCSRKRDEGGPSLSGIVKEKETDSKKALSKLAGVQGCGGVVKKLEFLGRVSSDPETRKRAKERAEWLKGQPSCKIPREKEKL